MVDEKEMAEFIGILLGDGSIGIYDTKFKNKIKKHYVIKISLDSRNKKYYDYVYKLMKKVLDVEPTIFFKKKENSVDIRTFKREKVFYLLNKIGLKKSPKWGNMRIPEKYCNGELARYVLKGLFDTDGSITIFNNNKIIYPRIEIKICPSPAQSQIIKILKESKIRFTVQKLDKGKIRIRISGKKELKDWFNKIGSSNELNLLKAKKFI